MKFQFGGKRHCGTQLPGHDDKSDPILWKETLRKANHPFILANQKSYEIPVLWKEKL